jgi:hypothetical protein
MNTNALVFHTVYWFVAYILWLSMTTAHHPTWTLRILCTGVLIAASALFACRFTPSELNLRQIALSVIGVIVCGSGAALLIHGTYDVLLGPDPRRFAFTSNLVMDIAFVFVNTIAAAIVATALSRPTGRQLWWLGQRGI